MHCQGERGRRRLTSGEPVLPFEVVELAPDVDRLIESGTERSPRKGALAGESLVPSRLEHESTGHCRETRRIQLIPDVAAKAFCDEKIPFAIDPLEGTAMDRQLG